MICYWVIVTTVRSEQLYCRAEEGCVGSRHLSRPLTPKETLHLEKSLLPHNNIQKSLEILPGPGWQVSPFEDEILRYKKLLQSVDVCVCDFEACAANALGPSSIGACY